jgi:hypothetical protein
MRTIHRDIVSAGHLVFGHGTYVSHFLQGWRWDIYVPSRIGLLQVGR